jgi:hypothetical protein
MIDQRILTGGMQFLLWLSELGASRAQGHTWRKRKMVTVCRIGKTLYISKKEIDRFWERAETGEFERELAGICAQKSKQTV